MHTASPKKIKNFQSVKLLPGFRCQLIDIIQFSENSIYLLNVCPMIRTYRNALYNSSAFEVKFCNSTNFDMGFILLASNRNDNVKSRI